MLIFQYKAGTAQIINLESPPTISRLTPFVSALDEFTQPSNVGSFNPDIESGEEAFGIQGVNKFNPVVESASSETGGHEDENAWWVNNFGSANCVDNEIVLVQPTPPWYTTTQQTNRYIFLDIGGAC